MRFIALIAAALAVVYGASSAQSNELRFGVFVGTGPSDSAYRSTPRPYRGYNRDDCEYDWTARTARGWGGCRDYGDYRSRNRMRVETEVHESIPPELKPRSYPCNPDKSYHAGPRPPGYCVKD